jgi:hypothetical protein
LVGAKRLAINSLKPVGLRNAVKSILKKESDLV